MAAAASMAESTAPATSGLRTRLASVLPKGRRFRFHHVSTPPYKTDALYSAPPNERPDRTFCENHFLAVSVDVPASASDGGIESSSRQREVIVLGIEVFVYTTAHATTLFVSKADSTGFLHLLDLPRGTPSPIRHICAAFVGYLVEVRRRKDVQFVVSLFARAQSQYLFPGSVDYGGKHVLDDRGLVKWWCRVLDPLAASPPVAAGAAPWKSVKGYIVVPGLDDYETRAFIPRTSAGTVSPHWTIGHPLERISHYTREFDWVPPRCLIPRFPDDPKSRFRDELDEEAARSGAMQTTGSWRSVKTLDMFWEMMAFRQECSSGRMTGFIWLVFDNDDATAPAAQASAQTAAPTTVTPETPKKNRTLSNVAPKTTPKKLFPAKSDASVGASGQESSVARGNTKDKSGKKRKGGKKSQKLRGIVKPRQARVKTEQRNYLLDRPTSSKYYHWPVQGRGERIVSEGDYKRVLELLLHLDFSKLDKAAGSSRRWLAEAGSTSGWRWGFEVTGEMETAAAAAGGAGAGPTQNGGTASTREAPAVNNLSGLVKRKRADTTEGQQPQAEPGVNVLSAGLVKKKSKHDA
ncbi:hypothetical protein PLIIFM63780_008947 [Purpureocillium lilacinum]|nr:hypothetical protein PLIIFM63780_008947 [Purpureocillium lilacinum]